MGRWADCLLASASQLRHDVRVVLMLSYNTCSGNEHSSPMISHYSIIHTFSTSEESVVSSISWKLFNTASQPFLSFLFLNNQTEQPLMLFSLAVSGSVPVLLIHFPSSALRNRGAYRSARAGKSERQSWACDGRRTWWWCSCLWHVIRAVTPVCRSPEPCTTRLIDSF